MRKKKESTTSSKDDKAEKEKGRKDSIGDTKDKSDKSKGNDSKMSDKGKKDNGKESKTGNKGKDDKGKKIDKNDKGSKKKVSKSEESLSSESEKEDIIYKSGKMVAVRCEAKSRFWLCKILDNVVKGEDEARVKWLDGDKANAKYKLINRTDFIPVGSIILEVILIKNNNTRTFSLSSFSRNKILNALNGQSSPEKKY